MPDKSSPGNQAPLAGINVLAIEQAIAAPLCTRQLAELGARVIKVERRETGDFARHYDGRVNGLCSHFVWTNRSKQSLTLDLKHPSALDILFRILPKTDVLVQNLAPSATDRLGLGWGTLHDQFPRLILCNISGYGSAGPYADKKAYDLLVQAEAGFLSVTGTPDDMVKSGISIADIAAGMQAHSAILAALIQRSRTETGSCIDVSLLEAMVEWMGYPLYYAYDGAEPPPRSGADHASIYPYGAFAAADGKLIMLGLQNEREWQAFCEQVLSRADLATDPRFHDNAARSEHRDELKTIIQRQFDSWPAMQITAKLDEAKIAYAHINDMKSVWQHPQLKSLRRIMEIDTANGPVKVFRPPGNNSSFEPVLNPVPDLGEHTDSILVEFGFNSEEIAEFRKQQVI